MSSTRAAPQAAMFFSIMSFLTIAAAVVYALLHWLQIPTGPFSTWVVCLLMLWWMAVVVTLPWNLHFQARTVISDARRSQGQAVRVQARDLSYVQRWATVSLVVAIGLHVVSAIGFYLLASYGITPIGYYGSGAALALIALRPAIRAYDYVASRIAQIGEEVRFPRDDVVTVKNQIEAMQSTISAHTTALDPSAVDSWAGKTEAATRAMRAEIEAIRAALEDLRRSNADEHRQLAHSAEQAAARIGEDAQVLGHVRELVRFFKQA